MSSDGGVRDDLSSSGDDRLATRLAHYLDVAGAGGRVDPETIRADDPELADRLVTELETLAVLEPGSGDGSLASLGDYDLLRRVGVGGMGAVYEARQRSIGRRVALKVLRAGVLTDPKELGRFIREAQIAGKLRHPNIVAVHDLGIDGGQPYFSMEFVDGETLAEVLSRRRSKRNADRESSVASTDEYRRIAAAFAEVADGLQHAHECRVIHRDVKPSNLIFDPSGRSDDVPDGRLRLLDFGLARIEGQESVTATGARLGTPLYMSPEQVGASNEPVDHRTDIFSLGSTLYEALTLEAPFRRRRRRRTDPGRTAPDRSVEDHPTTEHHEILRRIATTDPRPPACVNTSIPRDLETIVLKCLAKDPRERFGTAEALAQDLRRFVRGDPIESRPVGRLEKLARSVRRNARPLAVFTVVVLLAATVATLFWMAAVDRRRERDRAYPERVLSGLLQLQRATMLEVSRTEHEVGIYPWRYRFMPPSGWKSEAAETALSSAIESFSAQVESVPERPDAYWHRARAYVLRGSTDRALADLTRATALRPDLCAPVLLAASLRGDEVGAECQPSDRAESLWLRAQRAAEALRWTEAAAAFTAALKAARTHGEPWIGWTLETRLARGIALLEAGEPLEALLEFSVVRSHWPDSLEARLLAARARTVSDESHREAAAAVFEELYEDASKSDEVAYAIAFQWIAIGDAPRALRWLERVPPSGFRELYRGSLQYVLGNSERAIELLATAADGRPVDASYYVPLVAMLLNLQATDLAEQAVAKGLSLFPDDGMLLAFRAQLAATRGESSVARAAAEEARRVGPKGIERAFFFEVLATAYRTAGDRNTAVELYRESLASRRGRWVARASTHHQLGLLLSELSRDDEALEEFDRAIERESELGQFRSAAPWMKRAELLEKSGRIDDAIASYEGAGERFPPSPEPYRRAARLLRDKGDIDRARELERRALEVERGLGDAED